VITFSLQSGSNGNAIYVETADATHIPHFDEPISSNLSRFLVMG
jgi:hypothetical protein